MRILVVEDDDDIADFLTGGLAASSHLVKRARDGREGLLLATTEVYDVIILDRILPLVDGLKILAVLRATDDHTPVLLLSALSDVDERVKGLRTGANDYLTKPFAISELVARVEALARRAPVADKEDPTVLRFSDLELNLIGHEASRAGLRLDLTSLEFRFLVYLVRNAGRVITRAMLLEKLWDYSFDPQTNIVDQHVSRLRQKLEANNRPRLIHTLRGVGYVLRAPTGEM